jgi:hypothetical protein
VESTTKAPEASVAVPETDDDDCPAAPVIKHKHMKTKQSCR